MFLGAQSFTKKYGKISCWITVTPWVSYVSRFSSDYTWESHSEMRMSGNPYWCLNFVLEDFSVEAVYDQEELWLGNDTTKTLIHVMGMLFFLDIPNIFKTGFYKTGYERLYVCECMYVYS